MSAFQHATAVASGFRNSGITVGGKGKIIVVSQFILRIVTLTLIGMFCMLFSCLVLLAAEPDIPF